MAENYKDRKASLIAFGIVELLGGLLCACLALVTLIPLMLVPSDVSALQIVPGMLVYVFFSVWLIWMGIGTIRARRWARLLMLAGSWLALAVGVMAVGIMFFILPRSFARSDIPDEMVGIVLVITFLFMGVFYLLLPCIGVLFYGNRNVRATFEHSDPVPSWTEPCPLPVLVLVLMLSLAAASPAMLCFFHFAIPFFGTILSGWPGALIVFGILAICCSLAVGVFKVRPAAWWGVLAMLVLGVASQLITYGRIDMMDYYVAMGYTDQMLQQMKSLDWLNEKTFGIMTVFYVAPALVYLLWVKRYFKENEA